MPSQNFCYIFLMMLFFMVLLQANTGWALLSSDPVVEIHKQVGGTARFMCPVDMGTGDLMFMYLQKQANTPIFVNGIHTQNVVKVEAKYKNRSDVSITSMHVILWDLSPDDEGQYECIVRTTISTRTKKYQLTVTANYSQPQVREIHNDSTTSCQVTCSSSNGYPPAKVKWSLESEQSQAGWTELIQHPVTKLFSVFSTIELNVSRPLNVTCIVGNHTSVTQEVCVKRLVPPQQDGIIIIFACVLVSVLFIVGLAVVLQRRRCSRGRSPVVYSAAQRK